MVKKKIKILVTGADSQLGNCLRDISFYNKEYDFVLTDMDATNPCQTETFIQNESPEWIVNCIDYSGDNTKLNTTVVQNLVNAAKKSGLGFIQISSDAVFAGDNPEPLTEEDETNPISEYGKSKLEGEKIALGYKKSIVLRTSPLYSEYGDNFVKKMRNLAKGKKEIDVIGDQWGAPTSAHDLAKAVMVVIKDPSYGLYHFSNEGLTSWALFAEEIFSQSKIECVVNHISSNQKYYILSKKKFSKTFKIDIPEWEASLPDVIHKLDDSEHQ